MRERFLTVIVRFGRTERLSGKTASGEAALERRDSHALEAVHLVADLGEPLLAVHVLADDSDLRQLGAALQRRYVLVEARVFHLQFAVTQCLAHVEIFGAAHSLATTFFRALVTYGQHRLPEI